MRSHLDDGNTKHTNIVRPQGYKPEGAHGDVVDPRHDPSLSRRSPGGSLGDIQGAPDPRAKHINEEAVPANWQAGSTSRYSGSELPANDHSGNGFAGSGTQVSLSELERIDRANGTYNGSPVPPRPQQQQQQQQQLQPGAYQLQDGTILLVNNQGQRSRVTQEQYHRLMHAGHLQQAAQQAPPQQQASIMGAVMNILKGQ